VTPDGRTLLVHAWLDRDLRAYDISDPSVPSPPLLWTAPTVSAEPLPANVLAGKKLFYDAYDPRMARDGYATCAVCHPDGRDDGITWDFTSRGEGLRNTISLEGRAGTAMGPVHWTGNFDEIQDFENDIRNGQGGHGLLTDAQFADTSDTLGAAKAGLNEDLDALAAYVDSLTTTPPSPFAAPADGAARFAAKGCATCHSGEAYTDSALDVRHDIGTIDPAAGQRLHGALDGFDTPTLLGAWATGPYLHDGSALTVEEAITRHAQSDIAISAEDIEVIAGFVRSL
jgi:cytochrome c peroxidase